MKYRIVAESNSHRVEQVGPLIGGFWSRHDDELGRLVKGEFLIDTGASGAMIDLEVAEALHLSMQGSREVHGIHGYGRLQQFLGRVSLPARDDSGQSTLFSATVECVAVPSLSAKNRQYGVEVIGILGRIFLRRSRLIVDATSGRVELEIGGDPANERC
jgi:hypothetical protein